MSKTCLSMPEFSVIIPTCRRHDLLARCLESLGPGRQLADFSSYEVIVTDDSQTETAEAMIREQFPWVRWVQGPTRGPAANRNNGTRSAKGEWLCFIDDDCIADKGWISALRGTAQDPSFDLIEGQTIIPDRVDNPFLRGIGNENGGLYWSCNLAIRRSRFEALGGFDEDFTEAAGEDMEFAHRFHAHHFRSTFDPKALVCHPALPQTWRMIWKRHLLIRWSAMYAYKIDEGLHLKDSAKKNVLRAFTGTVINLFRRTGRDLRRWNGRFWRERWFGCTFRWVTFPVILPYYLYWVYRFHRQLNDNSGTGGASP